MNSTTGSDPPELQASDKRENVTATNDGEKENVCLTTDYSRTENCTKATAKATRFGYVNRKRKRCSILPDTDPRKKVRFDIQKRLFAAQATERDNENKELESLIQQFKETSF